MLRFNFLLIILFPLLCHSAEEWTKKTFTKNSSSHFYVGVSSSHHDLKLAMDEAYQNAINEAIKHNFGFYQKYREETLQTLKSNNYAQQTQLYLPEIKLDNIIPLDKSVELKEGKYLVYRRIEYPISEINKEKKRILKRVPLSKYDKVHLLQKKHKKKKREVKRRKFSFIYAPFYQSKYQSKNHIHKNNDEKESSFTLLPMKFEYYPSWLSLGLGIYLDEVESEKDPQLTINTTQFDFDLKINFTSRYLDFGIGAVFLYRNVSLDRGYQTLNKESFSTLGAIAALKIHMTKKQGASLYIEALNYNNNEDNSQKDLRIGLSFNF